MTIHKVIRTGFLILTFGLTGCPSKTETITDNATGKTVTIESQEDVEKAVASGDLSMTTVEAIAAENNINVAVALGAGAAAAVPV